MPELPTSDPSRIRALTERGHWGTHTLHSLLAQQVASQPHALAVADQPNKESPRRNTVGPSQFQRS